MHDGLMLNDGMALHCIGSVNDWQRVENKEG